MVEFNQLISADSHVTEPLDLWGRLPKSLLHLAPHLEIRDGRTCQVVEDRVVMRFRVPKDLMRDRRWVEGEELPAGPELDRITAVEELEAMQSQGAHDPENRLKDLDQDGIWAEVLYPNLLIFSLYRVQRPELQVAMSKLYNDWLLDTFGSHPRFVPMAALPILNIDEAVKELRRAAQRGFRGATLPVHADAPAESYNSEAYEPLWYAAEELGMPLHFHAGTGRENQPARNPGGAVINYVIALGGADETVCYLTGSGVLARHPDLRVVMVETGAGWLAWVLHAMDDAYREHHKMVEPKLDLLPSEYFRRQGYVTFQSDPVGLHNIRFTGSSCLMWGSDYPHPEGTWPRSRDYLREQMEGVSEQDVQAIVWDNAASLYGIGLPT